MKTASSNCRSLQSREKEDESSDLRKQIRESDARVVEVKAEKAKVEERVDMIMVEMNELRQAAGPTAQVVAF